MNTLCIAKKATQIFKKSRNQSEVNGAFLLGVCIKGKPRCFGREGKGKGEGKWPSDKRKRVADNRGKNSKTRE